MRTPLTLISSALLTTGSWATAEQTPFEDPSLVDQHVITEQFEDIATILFKDQHHGFEIQLPDDWELEEGFSDEHLDFVVVGVSPAEGPSDRFIENMNVLVEEIGDDVSLEQYFMWNLVGLVEELPNFEIHEKVNVVVNGVPMARVVYSWDLERQRTATYQYIFVAGNKGYVITFSADPLKFNNLRRTFDAVATSFAFQVKVQ